MLVNKRSVCIEGRISGLNSRLLAYLDHAEDKNFSLLSYKKNYLFPLLNTSAMVSIILKNSSPLLKICLYQQHKVLSKGWYSLKNMFHYCYNIR